MGMWSGFTINGDVLFDFLDHITARYMMPVCAFLTSLFVGWWLEREIIRNAITNWRNDSGWYLRLLISSAHLHPAYLPERFGPALILYYSFLVVFDS